VAHFGRNGGSLSPEYPDITTEAIKDYYYNELKQRKNCMVGAGTLSNKHLNKNLQALRKFIEYLRQTGKLQIPLLNIKQGTNYR